MGRYGRPKLPDNERRTALTLNVRFNKQEKQILIEKARVAGITATEWARFCALETDPPERRIIPELNREAWLELSRLSSLLNAEASSVGANKNVELNELLTTLQQLLADVRNRLIGNERKRET